MEWCGDVAGDLPDDGDTRGDGVNKSPTFAAITLEQRKLRLEQRRRDSEEWRQRLDLYWASPSSFFGLRDRAPSSLPPDTINGGGRRVGPCEGISSALHPSQPASWVWVRGPRLAWKLIHDNSLPRRPRRSKRGRLHTYHGSSATRPSLARKLEHGDSPS